MRGSAKLLQDFRIALLTRLGDDSFHPGFGSTLDGGISNGQRIPSFIGQPAAAVEGPIANEIRRVAQGIQSAQLLRIKADQAIYNKATLTASEILVQVSSITFDSSLPGTLTVTVTIQTGNGQLNSLNLDLSSLLPTVSV